MTGAFYFIEMFLTDRRIKNLLAHTNGDDPVLGSMYDDERCLQALDFFGIVKGVSGQGGSKSQSHDGRLVAGTA